MGPALHPPAAMRAFLLASLTIASTGCAALVKDPPKPNRPVSEAPQCSTGQGAVVLDGIMGTALGIGALALLADGGDGAGVGLGAALVSAVYFGSAYSGHSAASRCEVERKKFAAWQRQDQDRDRRAEVEAVAAGGAAVVAPPGGGAAGAVKDPFAGDADGDGDGDDADADGDGSDGSDAAPEGAARPPADPPPARPPDRSDPWRDFWKEIRP